MLAAIDAGSNTLRLLIGEVQNGKVAPFLYDRRICRLAGGFKDEEGLSPEAMERTLFAFLQFADVCEKTMSRR
jgi:exopolyphosphatase/guanosine-5'-triphosphate,3'-diphosphate pyrophosphatase